MENWSFEPFILEWVSLYKSLFQFIQKLSHVYCQMIMSIWGQITAQRQCICCAHAKSVFNPLHTALPLSAPIIEGSKSIVLSCTTGGLKRNHMDSLPKKMPFLPIFLLIPQCFLFNLHQVKVFNVLTNNPSLIISSDTNIETLICHSHQLSWSKHMVLTLEFHKWPLGKRQFVFWV